MITERYMVGKNMIIEWKKQLKLRKQKVQIYFERKWVKRVEQETFNNLSGIKNESREIFCDLTEVKEL